MITKKHYQPSPFYGFLKIVGRKSKFKIQNIMSKRSDLVGFVNGTWMAADPRRANRRLSRVKLTTADPSFNVLYHLNFELVDILWARSDRTRLWFTRESRSWRHLSPSYDINNNNYRRVQSLGARD